MLNSIRTETYGAMIMLLVAIVAMQAGYIVYYAIAIILGAILPAISGVKDYIDETASSIANIIGTYPLSRRHDD